MDAWFSPHHAAHHGHGELIGGRLLGECETEPSDATGAILDFVPYDGTGLPAGDYTFSPVITKGSGRCRDDQATRPGSYTVKIKS